jgi:hypothetical protein
MKKLYRLIAPSLVACLALGLVLAAGPAAAASHAGAMDAAPMKKEAASAAAPKAPKAAKTAKTRQQTKMGTCSKEAKAKSLKGQERKDYMSTCLKA